MWYEARTMLLFFKSSCKMCRTIVFGILILSSIILQMTQLYFFKTFLNVFVVVGLPLLFSSLTDSLLLVNSSRHRNVIARDTGDSPNISWMSSHFFVALNLTQNWMMARWSKFFSMTIITQKHKLSLCKTWLY